MKKAESQAPTGRINPFWVPRNGGALQIGSVASVTAGGSVSMGSAPDQPDNDWLVIVSAQTSDVPLSVEAGPDQQLTLPYNTATLQATASGGDGDLAWEWQLLSGPESGQLGGSDSPDAQLYVEEGGVYEVQVTVSDADESVSDRMTVFVNGWPPDLTGRHEAEDANLGNGLGYLDFSPGNKGGAYRDDDLDVQVTGDIGGGYNVGWIEAGERLDWSVLSQSGFYDVTVRVASAQSSDKQFRLYLNDRDVSGPVHFNTGGAGWQQYQDVVIENVESYGYFETVRLVPESGGFNINWIEFDYLGTKPPSEPSGVAVNAGGAAYTAADGTSYLSESDAAVSVSGGRTYQTKDVIDQTADDDLYQSERYGNVDYQVEVENGDYSLTLQFAEIYWKVAGKQLFDVSVEGMNVIDNIDLFSAAGGHDIAHDIVLPVTISDGSLDISLRTERDNAKLSAFRLVPVISGDG